jgi:hypothetical protein
MGWDKREKRGMWVVFGGLGKVVCAVKCRLAEVGDWGMWERDIL